mmetsp:Transcript_4178/g.9146  ORF Transcript_4178/g.9146 Transcript_4178/m.9146 type:complete len:346 (-) Transcript_4178:251-1288(-)
MPLSELHLLQLPSLLNTVFITVLATACTRHELLAFLLRQQICLVPHHNLRLVARTKRRKLHINRRAMRLTARIRSIHHVQHHVCFGNLFQRCSERRDQLRWQLLNEPDRVCEQHVRLKAHARQLRKTGFRVERGKQHVFRNDVRAGRKRVAQRRLARVCVPRNAHNRHSQPLPSHALPRAVNPNRVNLALEQRNPVLNQSAVHLKLRFSGSTKSNAAHSALAFEMRPHLGEPRKAILIQREFHLQLSLACLRVLREDVEDKRGAVEHFDAFWLASKRALKRALLRRRQLVVKHHRLGASSIKKPHDFRDFPGPDVRCCDGRVQRLGHGTDNSHACGFSERCEFSH